MYLRFPFVNYEGNYNYFIMLFFFRTLIEGRYMEKGKRVYVVFIDSDKAFIRVNWKRVMNILKTYGMEWKEKRLIKELYFNQKGKSEN